MLPTRRASLLIPLLHSIVLMVKNGSAPKLARHVPLPKCLRLPRPLCLIRRVGGRMLRRAPPALSHPTCDAVGGCIYSLHSLCFSVLSSGPWPLDVKMGPTLPTTTLLYDYTLHGAPRCKPLCCTLRDDDAPVTRGCSQAGHIAGGQPDLRTLNTLHYTDKRTGQGITRKEARRARARACVY